MNIINKALEGIVEQWEAYLRLALGHSALEKTYDTEGNIIGVRIMPPEEIEKMLKENGR